jgi:hypothetical protein
MLLARSHRFSWSLPGRAALALIAAIGLVLLLPATAFAHAELDPDEAKPGSVVDLTLMLENEQPDSPTINVQLVFPEGTPLTVAAIKAVAGWTSTVDGGGAVGGAPGTGITWSRPADSEIDDPQLPFTIGPLPTTEGPLEFKVLQTYANGVVDRWIESSTPGGPEPEKPAPVLTLTPGGAGSVPATSATTAASTSTSAPATTTTPTTAGAATDNADDSDDSNALPIVIAIAIALAAIGGGAYYYFRRRRRTPTP